MGSGGKEGDYVRLLQCHHQNDFCIKMGSLPASLRWYVYKLYAGTDWLKLVCQSEGGERSVSISLRVERGQCLSVWGWREVSVYQSEGGERSVSVSLRVETGQCLSVWGWREVSVCGWREVSICQSEGGERLADDHTLSIMSGRFVAATMVTPLSSTTPSISVRSCVRTLSATLFPPLDLKGLTTMTVQWKHEFTCYVSSVQVYSTTATKDHAPRHMLEIRTILLLIQILD